MVTAENLTYILNNIISRYILKYIADRILTILILTKNVFYYLLRKSEFSVVLQGNDKDSRRSAINFLGQTKS